MTWIQLSLELLGVFFFATSGSLLAARRGFDIIGSLMLGSLVGLGGGVLRDVVISQGPPYAFTSPIYLLPPALAALLVYFYVPGLHRLHRMLLTCDAAGLTLFCIIGTLTALNASMNPVSATLLGAMSAIGGGVIRDVVANEVPQIFHHQGLYAITALLGSGLTATLDAVEWFNAAAGLGIATLVFGLRMLSLRYRWKVPLAAACTTTP